jgi:hypothetical protein
MQSTIITDNVEINALLFEASLSPNMRSLPENFVLLKESKQDLWILKISVDNITKVEDNFNCYSHHLPITLVEYLARTYSANITLEYSYSSKRDINGIIKVNSTGIVSVEKKATKAELLLLEKQRKIEEFSGLKIVELK